MSHCIHLTVAAICALVFCASAPAQVWQTYRPPAEGSSRSRAIQPIVTIDTDLLGGVLEVRVDLLCRPERVHDVVQSDMGGEWWVWMDPWPQVYRPMQWAASHPLVYRTTDLPDATIWEGWGVRLDPVQPAQITRWILGGRELWYHISPIRPRAGGSSCAMVWGTGMVATPPTVRIPIASIVLPQAAQAVALAADYVVVGNLGHSADGSGWMIARADRL